jgi:plasmid replication initiation protein
MNNKHAKELKVTESSLCTKRNDFINTLTKFSLMEYRLFNYVASAIRNDVTQEFIDSGKDYITKIRISDVNDIFKTDNRRQYEVYKSVAKQLQQKIVEIPIKNGGIATVGIFKKQVYYAQEGVVYIEIDVDILPYITNLKKEFVQVSLNQARKFSSINAWRLFELCKQWERQETKLLI